MMNHRFFKIAVLALFLSVSAGMGWWLLSKQLGSVIPAWIPVPAPSSNSVPTTISTHQNANSLTAEDGKEPTVTISQPVPKTIQLPPGLVVGIFTSDTPGVRDLEFSPGGTLIASLPGEGKVVALPDNDKNTQSDSVKFIIENLQRPHGLVFFHNHLYVADETAVYRYDWDEQTLTASSQQLLFELPPGGRHWTRSLEISEQGQLFVSIGSTCDTCEENNPWHGSIIVSDTEGNNPQVWASGLRNAVFITTHPQTGQLWATEMGRDFLGDNTPPDEVNLIEQDQHYGWPYCYGNQVYDDRFNRRSPDFCQQTTPPVFQIPAHSAPLGLAFIESDNFPLQWQGDLLVAYHGSWNRSEPRGYKVVRLVMGNESQTIISSEDFMTGWLQENGTAWGRPVDLEFAPNGWLFISDDKAGQIYVVINTS